MLVTNDDGVSSPGLRALAEVARVRGHDTLVAAPSWDSSGSSAAVTGVTQGQHLTVEPAHWPQWAPGTVLAVDATPAAICRSALEGAYGEPPDLVLSGINRGANTGRAILHSGTVGAAFTAYLGRRPALAVSLALTPWAGVAEPYWETAVIVAGQLFDWISSEMPLAVVNCNVPGIPPGQLRGTRVGHLAFVGSAQSSLTESAGEQFPLTVGGAPGNGHGNGAVGGDDETDVGLLGQGYASVTAVVPVIEDPSLNLASALSPYPVAP